MIGSHHASAQFASEIGILLITFGEALLLLAQLLGGNGCRGPEGFEVECLVIVSCGLLQRAFPESVGIVAVERDEFAKRNGRGQFRPAGTGIEGKVEANLIGYTLEPHQVGAVAAMFVVKLHGDDGAAILPLQPLCLSKDLSVENRGIVQEERILTAHLTAFGEHPVGDTAIAHLTMAERAYTQHGYFLRFSADEIPEKKKGAIGVRGMKLGNGDYLEEIYYTYNGMENPIVYNDKTIEISRIKLMKRDAKGTKLRL